MMTNTDMQLSIYMHQVCTRFHLQYPGLWEMHYCIVAMLRIDLDLNPSGRDSSIDSSQIPVSYHASHYPVYFDPCSVARCISPCPAVARLRDGNVNKYRGWVRALDG
ncbi:hypothetical protein BDW67DRAFT_160658 [Aspergillus spinulosporus]